MSSHSRDVDLIVLGAGAAGMMAALLASCRGARVAQFDPHATAKNNFFISGGLFPAAGSKLQSAAGVADSPQAWLRDLQSFAPDSINPRIAESVAEALPEFAHWLGETMKAPLQFLPEMVAPGHSACRFHSLTPAGGQAFHAWCREQLPRQASLELRTTHAQVQRTGAMFEADDGTQRWRAPHLMLAGGGFAANPGMVQTYIPAMRGAMHNGSPTNDGSTIEIGLQWGAALAGMDGFQGQGHTNPGGATRLGMSIPTLGGIMVNRQARRFVSEDVGPSSLAPYVLAQDGGVALEIFDTAIAAQLANHSAYQEALRAGQVMQAEDVATLAQQAGVDPIQLQATLDEVRACARGERQDPLQRQAFKRVLGPPYLASWVTGALSHTQGGLATNGNGQVLDREGQVIPGVWAAGGCAAGLSGRGADGYLPGNGLAQTFGLTWRMHQALGG